MEIKKCHICKQDKEVSMFYKDKSRKDGYSSRCKDCDKIICKNENHEKYKSNYKNRRIKKIKEEAGQCCICGEKELCCLEFHHVYPKTKIYKRSSMWTYSKKELIIELNKCICICANCHRKVHSNKIILTDEEKEQKRIKIDSNKFDHLVKNTIRNKYERIQELIDNNEVPFYTPP